MREELTAEDISNFDTGITPACAGRTFVQRLPMFYLRDHPRVCGKNVNSTEDLANKAGSPPRVREELAVTPSLYQTLGITPACAGRTKLG